MRPDDQSQLPEQEQQEVSQMQSPLAEVQDRGIPEQSDQPSSVSGPTQLPEQQPIRWKAPEYLQHTKTPIWYVIFALIVIGLMALATLLMKSWSFAALIPVMAVVLLMYTHRPVRELNYVLSSKGVYIDDKLYPLGEFKSFGVRQDESLNSLVLMPVKRFRPSLSVYFPNEIGEQVVDMLGAYIPMQTIHLDAFDRVIRSLRI